MQSANNKFDKILSKNIDYVDSVIVPVERGLTVKPTQAHETGKDELLLNNTAIKLIYFGKSAVVYYWDEKKKAFDEIWVSD